MCVNVFVPCADQERIVPSSTLPFPHFHFPILRTEHHGAERPSTSTHSPKYRRAHDLRKVAARESDLGPHPTRCLTTSTEQKLWYKIQLLHLPPLNLVFVFAKESYANLDSPIDDLPQSTKTLQILHRHARPLIPAQTRLRSQEDRSDGQRPRASPDALPHHQYRDTSNEQKPGYQFLLSHLLPFNLVLGFCKGIMHKIR